MRADRVIGATIMAAAVAATIAPTAHATDGLSLPGFGAIVVDQVHKHLFVSSGPTGNSIVVTDFRGRVVGEIDGEFGATGLVLSADDSTLYAALAAGDAVSAVDTATLIEKARYTTPAQTCPTTLARTGQFLWIGYGCANSFDGGIGKLDTSAATPTITLGNQGPTTFDGAPLVTSGSDNGPVVAAQPNLSLSTVVVYTVNAGALQQGASGTVAGSNIIDGAVTPDGGTFLAAAGSNDRVAGFATADLSGRGSYPTGHFPNAVSVSPDGGFVAAGAFTSAHDVLVFASSGTSPVRTIGLGSRVTADRGLAWSSDGNELFVITQPVGGGSPDLTVVNHPTTTCTVLCLP